MEKVIGDRIVCLPTKTQRQIFWDVTRERCRQNKKHPDNPQSNDEYAVILMEEVGEVARSTFESDYENLREELIQTMAVCCRWVEELDNEDIV